MNKVAVKNLPDYLKKVLKNELKYGRREIEVRAATTISAQSIADDGCRGFVAIVDLAGQRCEVRKGSWGCSGYGRIQVDQDNAERPMPPNGVVIKGQEGGGQPVYATIYAHPDILERVLGPGGQT